MNLRWSNINMVMLSLPEHVRKFQPQIIQQINVIECKIQAQIINAIHFECLTTNDNILKDYRRCVDQRQRTIIENGIYI